MDFFFCEFKVLEFDLLNTEKKFVWEMWNFHCVWNVITKSKSESLPQVQLSGDNPAP